MIVWEPYSPWPYGRTKADLVSDLRYELNRDIPGIILNFTRPIIDTVTESVTGSSSDLAVIISGPDLTELQRLAAGDPIHDPQVPGVG
jgi:cobalt-zinc-cadmium resistance protein CzcA